MKFHSQPFLTGVSQHACSSAAPSHTSHTNSLTASILATTLTAPSDPSPVIIPPNIDLSTPYNTLFYYLSLYGNEDSGWVRTLRPPTGK